MALPKTEITQDLGTIKRIKDIEGVKTADANKVPVSLIRIEKGHNPRDYRLPENRLHLDELKASIRENGILVPVLVRQHPESKEIILVDGECRVTAALEILKEDEVEIMVPTIQLTSRDYPKEEDRLLAALAANQGKPLSEWELGNAFRKFIKYGWDEEKIATKLGYPKGFINRCISLDNLDEETKTLLSQRAITPAAAYEAVEEAGGDTEKAAETIKAKVKAKKASGKKGPVKSTKTGGAASKAKREKAQGEVAGIDTAAVVRAAKSLIKSAEADILVALGGEDGKGEIYEFTSIETKKLVALRKALGGK